VAGTATVPYTACHRSRVLKPVLATREVVRLWVRVALCRSGPHRAQPNTGGACGART